MKVVIYACAYRNRDSEEYDVKAQVQTCRDYAERHNFEVVGEYIDRTKFNVDSSRVNRPKRAKMMSERKETQFDAILAYSYGRLASSSLHYKDYRALMEKWGLSVILTKGKT